MPTLSSSVISTVALLSIVQAQSVPGAAFFDGNGKVAAGPYQLIDNYEGDTFFDKFNFYSSYDPTYGHVTYVNETVAEANGFVSVPNGQAKIIPDTTNQWPRGGQGRPSVRIISDNTYTHGLFIADFEHMPWGCGTWPAYWLLGPNWPYNGEIDIVEGVNTIMTDAITMHTDYGCTVAGSGQLATQDNNNCESRDGNNGCGSVLEDDAIPNNYGPDFNNNGGGVYAMEWTSSYIKTWFFQRGSIPADITAGTPDVANWGLPAVNAQGGCVIDQFFNNMSIIINTDFCGAWAGQVYSQYSDCPQSSTATNSLDSCVDYVGLNPGAFVNAYWLINSIKVYQMPENAQPASSFSTTLTSVQPSSTNTFADGMGATTTLASQTYTGPISSTASTQEATTTAAASATRAQTSATNAPATEKAVSCPASNGTITTDASGRKYEIICGYDTRPGSFGHQYLNSFSECVDACGTTDGCVDVTFTGVLCYFKNNFGTLFADKNCQTAVLVSEMPAASDVSCPADNNSAMVDSSGNVYQILCARDTFPGAFGHSYVNTFGECIDACGAEPDCDVVTFDQGVCYFKTDFGSTSSSTVVNSAVLASVYDA